MYRRILWYFLIIIFIFFGFKFTCFTVLSGLDLSWAYALNNIHLNGDYIFGRDVFFTYGPLGYLLAPYCYKGIVIQAFLFKIFIIFSYIFAILCFKERKNVNIFFVLVVLNFILFGRDYDFLEFLALMLAMVCVYADRLRQNTALILLNLLAFFMFFAKFNIGISCIATLIFTLISLKLKREAIVLTCGIWVIGLVLITMLYFGDFYNFIQWFRVSLLIASGYSEAMLLWRYALNQIYLLSALIIVGLYFSLWFYDYKKNNNECFKVFFVSLPSLFFIFKAGFVRADLHMMQFFTYMLLLIPLLYLLVTNISTKKLVIMYILALILPVNYFSTGSMFNIIPVLKYEHEIFVPNEYTLPYKWLDKIGSARVEILPYDFSYIEKNNLTPHYNPILQLYSVYTKSLDDISAENYRKQKTDYIIVDQSRSIDNRNLVMDNPATWDAIRENYQVYDFREKKILLEKREKPVKHKYETYRVQEFTFNDEISVPVDAKKAVVKMDLSLSGVSANFLLKVLPVFIYVTFNNGEIMKIRQVRDVMKNGIYIDEFILSMKDLDKWLQYETCGKNITSVRFYTAMPILYKKKFVIEWQK